MIAEFGDVIRTWRGRAAQSIFHATTERDQLRPRLAVEGFQNGRLIQHDGLKLRQVEVIDPLVVRDDDGRIAGIDLVARVDDRDTEGRSFANGLFCDTERGKDE